MTFLEAVPPTNRYVYLHARKDTAVVFYIGKGIPWTAQQRETMRLARLNKVKYGYVS